MLRLMNKFDHKAAVTRAIEAAGGTTVLADKLGITQPSVSQWGKIPVERVLDIERLTGIPRHDLRPDIYPQEQAA